MFQLLEPFPIKIDRIALPAKKKGSDIRHLTDIVVSFEGRNTLLDLFDAKLRPQFYRKVESKSDQEKLDLADDVDLPILVTTSIGMPLVLSLEFAGYRMVIDRGLGVKGSNVEVDEVGIKSIRVWLKEGGSMRGTMHLQTPNVSTGQVGQLRDFLKLETKLCLIAPEVDRQVDAEAQLRRDAATAKRGGTPAPAPAPAPAKGKGGKGATVTPIAGKKKPSKEDTARAATDEFTRLHDAQQAAAANKTADGAAPAA